MTRFIIEVIETKRLKEMNCLIVTAQISIASGQKSRARAPEQSPRIRSKNVRESGDTSIYPRLVVIIVQEEKNHL
jgi:hypothetical protein